MTGMNTGLEGTRRKYDTSVFERHELSNGIQVWLQKPPILTDEEGIVIAFLPKVGARIDPAGFEGIAHFFEHIPFRGTINRPTKAELTGPIEDGGGSMGANTSNYRTKYFVSLPQEHFELAVETLAEMTLRPFIREDGVGIERGTILSEYRMRMSEENELLVFHAGRTLLAGHPLGRLAIGSVESIERISSSDLFTFHSKNYHARTIHLICGGTFAQLPNALQILEHFFGSVEVGAPVSLEGEPALPFGKHGRVTIIDPAFKRSMLRYVYLLPPQPREGECALEFLASCLSVSRNSPLFIELREKRGLVYEAGLCSAHYSNERCVFGFICPTELKNFSLVEDIYRECLRNLDPKYVVKCQKQDQVSRKVDFTNPIATANDVVEWLTDSGHVPSFSERAEVKDNLTVEDVFRWRDYLLSTEPFVLEIRAS